jgi:hypothetical protein
MNSKGPNTDPCGTPPLMFPTSERQFCRTTFWFTTSYAISSYHHGCCEFTSRTCAAICLFVCLFVSWYLTSLSTIFQLYRGRSVLLVEETGAPAENHRLLEDEYDSDVSSANNREGLWISSVISLIYNMNSKGPNTDPCGTPPLMFIRVCVWTVGWLYYFGFK